MSYQAVQWALYQSPLLLTEKHKPDTTARQVLAVLAEHANPDGGNAFPSVLRIRYATGFDDRTIDRALLRLQRAGLTRLSGRTPEGTRIWALQLGVVRDECEWDEMVAEADAVRVLESARRKARRHRSSSGDELVPTDGVRELEDRMSGTQSTDIRDSASRMSGTERPPNHHEEPPMNHPATTTGGTLPPDPLRRPSPPSSEKAPHEDDESMTEPPGPAQDHEGESLPRASDERAYALWHIRATLANRKRLRPTG